jgi:hypothetical protein
MLRWITNEFPPGKIFSLDDLGLRKAFEYPPEDSVQIVGGEVISSRLMPIGWSRTIQEMTFMVTEVLCKEMGLLDSPSKNQYQVSPKGLLYLEGRRESVSSVGFCAMWFNPEVLPLWTDVIEPATREAGYEPLRIDSKQHNGKIDDEIMASIRPQALSCQTSRVAEAAFTTKLVLHTGLGCRSSLCAEKVMSFTLMSGNTTAFFGNRKTLKMQSHS